MTQEHAEYYSSMRRCIALGDSYAVTLPKTVVTELKLENAAKENRSLIMFSKAKNGVAVIYLAKIDANEFLANGKIAIETEGQ